MEDNTEDNMEDNMGENMVDPNYVLPSSSFKSQYVVSNDDYRDLVRDLGLSRRQTEILASRLKQWNLVENDFKITFTRNNYKMSFECIFKSDTENNDLVYCSDVSKLFASLNHEYNSNEWRLFIDGSCKSNIESDSVTCPLSIYIFYMYQYILRS